MLLVIVSSKWSHRYLLDARTAQSKRYNIKEISKSSLLLNQSSSNHNKKVPTSRSEVFKTSQMSMVEKRMMMQFVQACLKDNNFADLVTDEQRARTITFAQFLAERSMGSEAIVHYLLNAVAMCVRDGSAALPPTSAWDGLVRTRKFLQSVGHYGDSPFLFCMYGAGELSQCFCRQLIIFVVFIWCYTEYSIESFFLC